jgi:hypothetical protein
VVSGRWLLALVLAAGGCSLLVPVDDLVGGVPGDGGLPPDGTSCGDVQRDPNHCGVCGHSCLGGECNRGRCQPLIVARNQEGPAGIFVPPADSPWAQYVFWVTRIRPALRRALKDGTGSQTSLESNDDGVVEPFDLVLDDQYVYWSEVRGREVRRKALPGGKGTGWMGAGGGEARYLAIFGSQQYVTGFEPTAVRGLIVSDNALYQIQSFISGLAVSDNVLFWIERDLQRVVSGVITGGMNTTELSRTGAMPGGLAVDDVNLYWIEEGRRLQRKPKVGGAPTTTVYEAPQPIGDSDVGVDDRFVYWTESANGVVLRVAK